MKYKILGLLFVFSFLSSFVFAQKINKLEDYGLSEESVKYLTEQEIQEILNSKTLKETQEEYKNYITTTDQNKLSNEVVDCFDYYKFGSIQTDITTRIDTITAGDTIDFSGPIYNNNNYPIVSGKLYVKIFRERNVSDPNGPDVVDQFVVAENIIIPANSSIPVSFSWKTPEYLINGNYKIASFFVVDNKFNLLGLSFTDDVIGNYFNFRIVSGREDNVMFDKAGVEINNKPFYFATFPPKISTKEIANIKAKIDNNTSFDEEVETIWNIYKWDSMNKDNLLKTISERTTVKAKSSSYIELPIEYINDSVYYIVGELKYRDSKSIVGIRFVRPEVDKIRLNFPSILDFPIKKNATSTVFSCLHNSGTSDYVENNKIILKVLDKNENIISEYTYKGDVSGEMMAVKKDFISKKNFDYFIVFSELYQGEKLIDQSKMVYDCNQIDSKLCSSNINIYLIISAILLFILILFFIIKSIRGRKVLVIDKKQYEF
jgi:hypothetical protein